MTRTVGLTGLSRCAAWFFGWVVPLSALLVQVIYGLAGSSNSLVTALGFLGCYIISVVLHELGHLLAGKVLGLNPVLVSFGHGDLLCEIFFVGITWRFHTLAFSGYVYPFPLTGNASRTRMSLMLAAAPLLNALGAACCLFLMVHPDLERLHSAGKIDVEALVLSLFLVNSFVFIRSFTPLFNSANDGEMIWKLWRPKRVLPSEMSAEPSESAGMCNKSKDTSASWKAALELWPLSHLLSVYRQRIHSSNITTKEKLENMDGFATAVLMSGASAYLREADEYSRTLAEAKPTDCSALATRGSILVELGRVDDGMKMLQLVYDHEQTPFDRGLVGTFMALGHAKRNDFESARRWASMARQADQNCVPLVRVETLVKQSSADQGQSPKPVSIGA